jgi:hypothetical protein
LFILFSHQFQAKHAPLVRLTSSQNTPACSSFQQNVGIFAEKDLTIKLQQTLGQSGK